MKSVCFFVIILISGPSINNSIKIKRVIWIEAYNRITPIQFICVSVTFQVHVFIFTLFQMCFFLTCMEELRNRTRCAALIIWDYKVSVLHCCQTFVEFHFGLISQNTLQCGAKSVRRVSVEEGRLRCHINIDIELDPVLKC